MRRLSISSHRLDTQSTMKRHNIRVLAALLDSSYASGFWMNSDDRHGQHPTCQQQRACTQLEAAPRIAELLLYDGPEDNIQVCGKIRTKAVGALRWLSRTRLWRSTDVSGKTIL